ncbi:phosphoribosylaminoimidazolecarboxamide formyltransferase [Helicobacter mehlei]|uniref:Phosphoribosylaminoimidazolecarboxamide formyltransferase n=1 Tax=Helicobacter mehlei TaxID=2316080 RepID=A0A553UNI1_9HELI|nr:phosphoribosylaminoimidazolecarboxamide formyltransferase [Helicobacter mehlei]TSA81760.1 phosphoribosylaminoimidazolecarboxamide formyltransferase [Helicobacter mehlei]
MPSLPLKYGINPHQLQASLSAPTLPLKILNGNPSYINFLDALNGYQLVKELEYALKCPAATSFKHASPTSSALARPLEEARLKAYFLSPAINDSPIATAYARARGADRLSSFGDFVALSAPCDLACAQMLSVEVSDGIIAPDFEPKALELLKQKKKGGYVILQIDPSYTPPLLEKRDVFGLTLTQERNHAPINLDCLKDIVSQKKELPTQAKEDLILSLITLKYTQSNSICLAYEGQAIGVGAGQQSRIYCTKIAADKADLWHLRVHPKVLDLPFRPKLPRPTRDNLIYAYLTHGLSQADLEHFTSPPEPLNLEEKVGYLKGICGVSLGSDAFFPFSDSLERAALSGVGYVAQSGGSKQDKSVIATSDALGMVMIFTHLRLFHH